jgi:hypothetical protein
MAALGDLGTVNRWREKVVSVAGSECWWWTRAISGSGHGRFYPAPGRVIISHRFAFGLVHGTQVLEQVRCSRARRVVPPWVSAHPLHASRGQGQGRSRMSLLRVSTFVGLTPSGGHRLSGLQGRGDGPVLERCRRDVLEGAVAPAACRHSRSRS